MVFSGGVVSDKKVCYTDPGSHLPSFFPTIPEMCCHGIIFLLFPKSSIAFPNESMMLAGCETAETGATGALAANERIGPATGTLRVVSGRGGTNDPANLEKMKN